MPVPKPSSTSRHSAKPSKTAVAWCLRTGFTSGNEPAESKQPIHIGMKDDSLFAFAGIWDRWKDASGNVVETCSILTTDAKFTAG